jgi:hypothetical protein
VHIKRHGSWLENSVLRSQTFQRSCEGGLGMANMTVAYRRIKLGNPRPLVLRLASPHSGSNSTACTAATGHIHATGTQPTDNFSDASTGRNKRRFVYRLSICDVLHFNAPGTDADASCRYDGHDQSRNPPRIKNFSLVSSLSPLFERSAPECFRSVLRQLSLTFMRSKQVRTHELIYVVIRLPWNG